MSQTLLVWLSGDFDESDLPVLKRAVELLGRSRSWTVSPPEFVDETDASSCTTPEDEPIRTVGAALVVTEPDSNPGTPREEASAFIDALAAFSKARGADMEVQIGDTYAGEIRAGIPDQLLVEGLLARW